jgi:hypothetical protein
VFAAKKHKHTSQDRYRPNYNAQHPIAAVQYGHSRKNETADEKQQSDYQ